MSASMKEKRRLIAERIYGWTVQERGGRLVNFDDQRQAVPEFFYDQAAIVDLMNQFVACTLSTMKDGVRGNYASISHPTSLASSICRTFTAEGGNLMVALAEAAYLVALATEVPA